MIISHKHKFIFLKTKKTAGTSIEMALSAICGPEDILTPISAEYEDRRCRGARNYRVGEYPLRLSGMHHLLWTKATGRGFYDHAKAHRVRNLIGPGIWRDYFKFSFERNPWDRQVSLYKFRKPRLGDEVTFDDFMERREARINNFSIYAVNGSISTDFIGRFENIEMDFRRALEMIGLEKNEVSLPVTNAAWRGKRKQPDYSRYYTPTLRDKTARWYAREIEAFGYEF